MSIKVFLNTLVKRFNGGIVDDAPEFVRLKSEVTVSDEVIQDYTLAHGTLDPIYQMIGARAACDIEYHEHATNRVCIKNIVFERNSDTPGAVGFSAHYDVGFSTAESAIRPTE